MSCSFEHMRFSCEDGDKAQASTGKKRGQQCLYKRRSVLVVWTAHMMSASVGFYDIFEPDIVCGILKGVLFVCRRLTSNGDLIKVAQQS